MTTNFTISDDYVITAIEVDGMTYNCSMQITSDWDPFLEAFVETDGTITGVSISDNNNETNFVASGDCGITVIPEEADVEVTYGQDEASKPWWQMFWDLFTK